MNWNLLGKSTIAALAFSGLAVAGDVRISDNLVSAVSLSNGLGLNCAQVSCSGSYRGPSFASIGTSQDSVASSAVLTNISSFSSTSNSLLAKNMLTAITAAISAAAPALPDPSTVAATSTTTDSSGEPVRTFILSNGRVINPADGISLYAGLPDPNSIAPRVVSYGVNDYPDPIFSPGFNTYSTTLATSGDFPVSTPSINTVLAVALPVAVQPATSSPTATPASDPISTLFQEPAPSTTSDPVSVAPGSGFSSDPSTDAPITTPDSTPVDSTPVDSTPNVQTPFNAAAPSDAPEPATDLLIGTGLVAAGAFARSSKRSARRS